ncbi:MAG TPA: FAD-dependent thymidylate synthase [Candidatus Eisenbacteria bacterium]|nr:FAD-dependent thymidylate synthase [Candidatus Eisenbacteria bacterium]
MSNDANPAVHSTEIPAEPGLATDVYAVHGADPEVLAYGMAKYSRSALSLRESLSELNEQKAEKFLNTFYFQYGHRSIADLAHLAFAIEKLSILAATVLVDEPRWDGQERSTRYQDFQKSGYFVPDIGNDTAARDLYCGTIDFLFAEYRHFSEQMFQHLRGRTPKPEEMKQDAYERTLKARAFDLSRYLLPLATNTSLGQIVSARTLENQVSRLLSHPHAEVRKLGELLKKAAREAAYDVNYASAERVLHEVEQRSSELADRLHNVLLREVHAAPTLMKYAEPNAYEQQSRRELRAAAIELLGPRPIDPAPLVDLLEDDPLEVELATTLLYQHSHHSYRQIRGTVEGMTAAQRAEIIDLGLRHRGRHDEVARAYYSGQKFRFDILMDIGGFRDMHRHRRCVQILQDYTTLHSYERPEDIDQAGLAARYHAAMTRARETSTHLASRNASEAVAQSQYVIPLAYRKRALFKMDFAEALYISELRTGPAGHFSYRNVAYAMYEAVAMRFPELAKYFRVTDVREPVDLLKR